MGLRMKRRKKGQDIHGWLLIDKPIGIGSTPIVSKLRWLLEARKAGHAGTLDPQASGLLAVAFGEATKTIFYMAEGVKTYHFTMRFGQETETDDAAGHVTKEYDFRPQDQDILRALSAFEGDILQVPPRYSAVKYAGKRAYALARMGEDFTLLPRALKVKRFVMRARPTRDYASFELICSKGGYVRAIARDLGRSLGCGGHVVALRRVHCAPFAIAQALDWQSVCSENKGGQKIKAHLLPLESGLVSLPEWACDSAAAKKLENGNPVLISGISEKSLDRLEGLTIWVSYRARACAIGRVSDKIFHPKKVIHAHD